MIDLRSDTVTKPDEGMKKAMFQAEVGDDVFQEDVSINELQEYLAKMFGHEAGLFCPSGTMTNQIAVNVHTQPGDEIICSDLCHIYNYEGAGAARLSGVQVKLTNHPLGLMTAGDVLDRINPPDSHYANTSLVCLEDTVNKAGGVCYDIEEIKKIRTVCKENGLGLHLDGARFFNALVKNNHAPIEYGQLFDSISICLSKGLGSPSGSVLLGSSEFIAKAHRVRKVMGGGMRQAGFIAAAGLYGIKNNVQRLADDHRKARVLADALTELPMVSHVTPPETNIVIFDVADDYGLDTFLKKLNDNQILALPFSRAKIRFVTHLDFTEEQLTAVLTVLKQF